MDSNQERMPIAHNVRNVLKSFRTAATSFNHEIDSLKDQAESHDLRELLLTLENENVRFKMWAGNLAAHQSGPASLDHRLREAPHIQEQVVYLLRDISESLEDTIVIIPQQESSKGSKDIGDKPNSLPEGSDQDSEDSFTDSDLDDDESLSTKTRISTSCADITEAIDCLLRLSLAIANPAPHERFRKLGAGPDEDVSFYEAHDIRYVQDKFPKISQDLPGVLGKSITRRRQFFKYREAHHAKLAAGLDQMTQKDTSRTEVVPNTVASSLPEHLKGSGVIDEDNRSDMAMSETSYATSAGYLTIENGGMKPAPPLKVPPRPPEADRGVFECPFCYRMISASTRGAWKRHVFGDLRPYTCLFSRCAELNTDFDRRHRWQLHVSQYHWRTWSCPSNCGSTFSTAVELGDHIRHQHLPNASDEHISTVVARGKVSVSDDVTKECPFCGQTISGLQSYIKHVGRHLEQLALFALPSIGNEQPKDGDESDKQGDDASELGAIPAYEDSCETSPKAHEVPETSDTSSRHAITFENDGEGYAMSGEHDTVPSAAAPISSGQPTFEPVEVRNGVPASKIDTSTLKARIEKQLSNLSSQSRTQVLKEFEEMLQKRSLDDIMADIFELQVQIGFKEQERLPIEPSDEAGPVAQDFGQTYTRFARKHLSLETLREFNVGFDLDADPEYVLVRRRVPEWEQDRMWEHTKLIREKRDKVLREETPYWSGEHEFESVRETDRRHAKSPSRFHGHGDKDFDELLEQFKPVHNYYDAFGNQSPKPGKRNTSPPPGLPSVDERERIYIRTSRERGAPPSPSPPPQVLRGPTIEREVTTHYRDIDHSALPENKNTLCRNVLIYGHCRYEDQGCAFSHDQNNNDSKTQGQGEREYQSDLPG